MLLKLVVRKQKLPSSSSSPIATFNLPNGLQLPACPNAQASGVGQPMVVMPTGIAIEQRVLSPKVQAWVVEEKPDRNRAQLTGGGFAQRLVERMQDPLSSLLHLGCDCERVVFLGQSLAVLLYNSANRYTADNGRRNTEALEHAGSPVDKGKKGESCGEETQTDTRNRREPGFVSAYCDENSG